MTGLPRYECATPGRAVGIAASIAAMVPVLTTARLTLRAPRVEDFASAREILCSDRARYMNGPLDRKVAWTEFSSMLSSWMLYGHGGWAIVDKATGDVHGFVMIGLEPGDYEVELGYCVREEAEGKGIAFEATSAARDWAWQALELPTLVSYIDTENERSIALAQRLGAYDDSPHDWTMGKIFRHPNPEAIQ